MTERIDTVNITLRFADIDGQHNNVGDVEMPPRIENAQQEADIDQNPYLAGEDDHGNPIMPSSWKKQLDSLLLQAAEKHFGDLTYEEVEYELDKQDDLPDILKEAILVSQETLEQRMKDLHSLTGEQIIQAFQTQNKATTEVIDKAVAAQQTMAAKLRSLKVGNPDYTLALETMADKCDRRASEITCAVLSVINPPGAEEMLLEMGKMPPILSGLKDELANCGFNKKQSKAVMQAYANAVKALETLGKSDAISLADEIKGNPQCKHQLFEKAADALDTLSTALHRLHGNAQYSEALENMALAIDHHIAHLATLGNELPTLLDARRNSNMRDLMISVIPDMHGTQAVLSHFENNLSPLLQTLDNYEQKPETIHSIHELYDLNFHLLGIKDSLARILRDGQLVMQDGSKFIPDQSLIDSLRGLMDKAQASIQKFKGFFSTQSQQLSIAARQTFPLVDINPILNESEFFCKTFPTLAKIAEYSNSYRTLEAKALKKPEEALAELKELNKKIRKDIPDLKAHLCTEFGLLNRLKDCIRNHKDHKPIAPGNAADILNSILSMPVSEQVILDPITAIDDNQIQNFLSTFLSRNSFSHDYNLKRIEGIFLNQTHYSELRESFMQGSVIRRAMHENIPLTTIIESQLNGATPDMIDEICDDINLIGDPIELGQGQANTVYLCNYKNDAGKTARKVFKSEYKGSMGNLELMLSYTGAPTQQNAHLNISSKNIAGLLNVGDLIPKSSVGMLKGEYGLFMDFVDGYSPKDLNDSYAPAGRSGRSVLSKREIRSLSPENRAKVRWQLMKKCNQLQWTDLLTAQGDRHHENYKISVDRNLEVTLQGIDNDACLMDWKIGISKVRVTPTYLGLLKDFVLKDDYNSFMQKLRNQGAVLEEGADTFVLDTSKVSIDQQDKLRMVLGFQSFKIPDYMDYSIYQGLMDLEQHPNKLQECLPPDLTPAARSAAFNRLQDMIEMAHKYSQEGKVLQDHDWQSPDKQQAMFDSYKKQRIGKNTFPIRSMKHDLFFRDFAEIFSI